MTNTIALCLGALILGAFVVDAVLYEWTNTVFLFRKFVDLIKWVAFWR